MRSLFSIAERFARRQQPAAAPPQLPVQAVPAPGLAGDGLPPPPLLDAVALDAIRGLQPPAGPDLLTEVIDLYLLHTPPLLDALVSAAATADAGGLRRAAHALKSGSASLGAMVLVAHCQRLESLAKGDNAAGAAALVAEAEQIYRATCAALGHLRREHSA